MSGLEIAAGIAGIISGFITVGRAVKAFQKSRKKKKQWLQSNAESAENRLICTIDNGPSRVNHEYNHDLQRIGKAFAQGDGNSIFYVLFTYSLDIARNSLFTILIEMNSSLVNVIQSFIATDQVLFSVSEYDTWNTVGARMTDSTVSTLAQLYQRKHQSAPIPRSRFTSVIDSLRYGSLQSTPVSTFWDRPAPPQRRIRSGETQESAPAPCRDTLFLSSEPLFVPPAPPKRPTLLQSSEPQKSVLFQPPKRR